MILKETAKKKILVVLQHYIHVRNFIGSGFLNKLSDAATLCLVMPEEYIQNLSPELNKQIEISPIEDYRTKKFKYWLYDTTSLASIVQRRRLNNTYKKKFQSLLQNRKVVLKVFTLWLLSYLFDLEKTARRITELLKINKNAVSLVHRFKPDIVFSPTLIYLNKDVDLVIAAKKTGAKSIFLVDSWDNLTSKGFFLVKPDLLLVWGEADKESAVREHGFKDNEVVVTGSFHYDLYFSDSRSESREDFLKSRGINSTMKIILFAGTTFKKYANEPLMLRKISEHFRDRDDLLFWYRPHPRNINWENLVEAKSLPNVYVDDQIWDNFSKRKTALSVEKEYLEFYPRLINSCIGVLSIFSTMVIEFALLRKPSILIDFILDEEGRESSHERYKLSVYAHLQEVLGWEGVFMSDSLDLLYENIERLVRGEFDRYGALLQKKANRIAHNIDGNAQGRILSALIGELCKDAIESTYCLHD